jgi:hypothetical protein
MNRLIHRIDRRQFLKTAGQSALGLGAAIALDGCGPVVVKPAAGALQKSITQVDAMPNIPSPFSMKDWKKIARGYDALVFDFNQAGDYLPLIWWDRTHINLDRDTFGLYSYVGDNRQGTGGQHEAINCIAAVLGASLVGIDKSSQNGQDWVAMLESYFNSANKLNLVLNNTSGKTGQTFWYEIYPGVLFFELAYRYPQYTRMAEIIKITADRWYDACVAMGGSDTTSPDFGITAFDFEEMRPKFNGQWKEPDGAAGVAWMEYMAWTLYQDPRYLQAAKWCLAFLQNFEANPLYEHLLTFGAYLAVRINAEIGEKFDTQKLIDWCFEGGSYIRKGWGIVSTRWGDYDCHGLAGLRQPGSGYAFAMNTFAWAGALTPIARYDTEYARAIGKWILNLANNARLFYADGLPESQQSSAFWKGDPGHVIAYEGLQEIGDTGRKPFAAGDPLRLKWGKTDFGLYGSSHVGMLAGLVEKTSDEKILQIDLLATDFFHGPAFPTYLYYNPYSESKPVDLFIGETPKDIYDATNHRFLKRGASEKISLEIPADTGVVIVLAPKGGEVTYKDNHMLVNHTVTDYSATRPT